MAARNSDVSLVIRARDEASSTLKNLKTVLASVTDAQQALAAQAGGADKTLTSLVKGLEGLKRGAADISGSLEASSQAVGRQAAALRAANSSITERKARIEELIRAQQLLQKESSKEFVGPRRENLGDQLGAVNRRLGSERGGLRRDEASYAKLLSGLRDARGAFRELQTAERDVQTGIQQVTAAIDQQTLALNNQTIAAQKAAAVRTRVADITRPESSPATENGAGFEALAEREIQLQERRAAAARQAAAAVRQSIAESTGTNRRAATENGATFSALGAREEAKAVKAAADAHAKFEETVRKGAREMREMENAASELRDTLNPVAKIERQLAGEQAKLNSLFKAGMISSSELAGGMKLLDQQADRMRKKPKVELFGLKPYETQNLLYQLNDIATQIGSGTSLSQTLAQQGGQILQLFPRVGATIATALTSVPVLTLVGSLGVLVLALNKASTEAEKLRTINAILTLNADGARYQAQALGELATEMQHYGISAESALKIVRTAVAAGFDINRVEQFGRASQDMADVLGIEATDAAEQLAAALTGGFAALDKFDEKTQIFTASQREMIRGLYAQGQATEAAARAQDIISGKLAEAAAKQRGPWTDAIRALAAGWESFLGWMAQTDAVEGMIGVVERLGKSASYAFREMSGNLTLLEKIEEQKKRIASIESANAGNLFGTSAQGEANLAAARAELDRLQAEAGKTQKTEQAKATELQGKADQKLKESVQQRLDGEAKITGQKQIQARLDALRTKLNLEYSSGEFAKSSKAVRDAAIQQQIDAERVKLNKELADYKKQQAEAAKAAAAADEQALRSYVDRVVKAESGGNRFAKNPNSSATGSGQFLEQTWLDLFRKHFPERADNMGRDAILALRNDAELSRKMIELYARENAKALQNAGKAVTEANLHLAHFLGAGGANKVLNAAPGAKISDVLTGKSGRAAIAANPTILGGNATAGSVIAYAQKRAGGNGKGGVGSTSQTELEGEARLLKIEQDRQEVQDKFNDKVADENEKRRLAIASMEAQRGLIGEALISEQKKQAVAEAVLQKQQEIDKLNADRANNGLPAIEFSDAQRKEIEATTGAYYDLAHAREKAEARLNNVQQPVDDLIAQRDGILQQIQFYEEQGNTAMVGKLGESLVIVNQKLEEGLQNVLAFWEGVASGGDVAAAEYGMTAQQVQNVIDRTKLLQAQTAVANDTSRKFLMTSTQIKTSFATGAASAFDRFAQSVAQGGRAFKSLGDAFRQFAADFLRQIAQMIIQQMIFNAISGALGGGGGGGGGGGRGGAGLGRAMLGGGGGAPGTIGRLHHDGGVVGEDGTPRLVNPAWFENARRYHDGGIAGLKPNEVPAVLERGEEVLTRADARHRDNGGAAGSGNVTNVNLIDADAAAQAILDTPAGTKAVLNIIRLNRRAAAAAMGN